VTEPVINLAGVIRPTVTVTRDGGVKTVRVLVPGPQGLSAYDVAVAEGFSGTEAEWLASLRGEPGEPGLPRAITVPYPRPGDAFTIFYTEEPVTLAQVRGLVRGDSPSVAVELRYAADRSAAGTLATAPITLTNSTTGQAVTVQNMPIPAGRFVWLVVTDVTGTVEEVSMTLAT
jgi:hypothetical protein